MKWFKKKSTTPPPKKLDKITNTWLENFTYDFEFLLRYEKLLNLLPTNLNKFPRVDSILDLGCGMQYLREVMKHDFRFKNVQYLGVDLYAHKNDTIICDFNQKEFPKLSKDYRCVVCAGLFEYIVDLEFLIEKICALEPCYVLCSYNFKDFNLNHNPIWVKKLHTQEELFGFFMKRNFKLLSYKSDENKEKLTTGYFLFFNQNYEKFKT